MSKKREVLITGGAGFIGRRIAEFLAESGFSVTILDIELGRREALLLGLRKKVKFIEGDVKDRDVVTKAIKGKDVVLHLAAGASFLMYEDKPVAETVNVIHGFLNVLECLKQYGCGKLIYASTSAVYEGNLLPYYEGMKLCPPDHKALAKKIIEEFAALYSRRYGIKSLGIRPFSVYGCNEIDKGGFANIISLFSWAMIAGNSPVVWGDGEQTRDFIYVDDLAEMFCLCIETSWDVPVINAGTGVETSFNEVICIINELLDTSLDPIYVDVPVEVYARRLLADTTLQESIGFRPKVNVRDGISKVLENARRLNERERVRLGMAQRVYTPMPEKDKEG